MHTEFSQHDVSMAKNLSNSWRVNGTLALWFTWQNCVHVFHTQNLTLPMFRTLEWCEWETIHNNSHIYKQGHCRELNPTVLRKYKLVEHSSNMAFFLLCKKQTFNCCINFVNFVIGMRAHLCHLRQYLLGPKY